MCYMQDNVEYNNVNWSVYVSVLQCLLLCVDDLHFYHNGYMGEPV